MKKFARDIIILHMCTKNHNHMMDGSWDMEWDRQNYLSFWVILCPFNTPFLPRMILKIKLLKRKINVLQNETYHIENIIKDIILPYIHMYHKWRSSDICSWNLRCNRQKFLSFLAIFCSFNPLTTWKIKILKSKKTPGVIIFLHICTINDNHVVWFLSNGSAFNKTNRTTAKTLPS